MVTSGERLPSADKLGTSYLIGWHLKFLLVLPRHKQ